MMKIAGIAVASRFVIPSSKSFQFNPTRFAINTAYADDNINNACIGISNPTNPTMTMITMTMIVDNASSNVGCRFIHIPLVLN